jgi:hypothetical protein
VDGNWQLETTLDVEWAHAVCTGRQYCAGAHGGQFVYESCYRLGQTANCNLLTEGGPLPGGVPFNGEGFLGAVLRELKVFTSY